MNASAVRFLFVMIGVMVLVTLAAFTLQRLMDTKKPRVQHLLHSPWWPVALAVVVWSIYTIVAILIRSPGSTLRALLESLPMGLFMVGVTLASQLRTRRGTTLRCVRCDYDLSGLESPCPECGSAWSKTSGTVLGTRAWSPRILLLALPLMLPLLATFILPFFGGPLLTQRLVARVLPTDSLIADAAFARGFTTDTWAELNRRTLTPAQRETLAQGLLTRTALQLHAWGDEAKWLTAEFAAGRLSLNTQRAVLSRFVPLALAPDAASGTSIIGIAPASAWGLGDAFLGWSLFVVRGPAMNELRIEVAPPHPDEIALDRTLVATPPDVSVARKTLATNDFLHTGPVPAGATVTLWLIAEPRQRGPQPVIWSDGTPMTAPDALLVRLDLTASK
jgi:hypothetical protein